MLPNLRADSDKIRKRVQETKIFGMQLRQRTSCGRESLMSRFIVIALVLAVLPRWSGAAEMSADEILLRMRQQALPQATVATTRPGIRRGVRISRDNRSKTATDSRPVPRTPVRGDVEPGDTESVKIELQIFFEFDSAKLASTAKPQMAELCNAFRLARDIEKPFRIIGHTDAVGNERYNRKLSKERAAEVRRFLVEDCGVEAHRLLAEGRGESELRGGLNPRDPRHRRVQVEIIR